MYSHRVHVFHRAYANGGIVAVAHNLKLHLLVAFDALLYENLVYRALCEGVRHKLAQLGLI